MKYIKTFEHCPWSYGQPHNWAIKYWVSKAENFPDIEIVRFTKLYLDEIFQSIEKDGFISTGYYADRIFFYFKEDTSEETIIRFKKFLKEHEFVIEKIKTHTNRNVEYQTTTIQLNYEKLAGLYKNVKKYNL